MKKTANKEHLQNAMGRVKGLIAQVVQAADEDVGRVEAAISSHTGNKSNPHGVTASQIGAAAASHSHSNYVPTTRKVNGKALRADISLTASDVGAAPLKGSVTIPTTGWGSDSTVTYPKYYDIAVTGVTTSDRANVDIAPASLGTAVVCGLCPTTETLAGKIRIRAASVPVTAMTANYWIERGA